MDETPALVLKVGGRETDPSGGLGGVVEFVVRAQRAGREVVVVHGGGEEVTERATALGLPTRKVEGQRVTDAALLEVVVEVLAGRVNARVVNALTDAGVPAVGLTGLSGRLLPVRPAGEPPGALGFVGEPTGARVRILRTLLNEGYTPVVAPIGTDQDGGVYNVNADRAAGAIAAAMGGELVLLTDVPAVRSDDGAEIRSVAGPEVEALVVAGTVRDGMIPKLRSAARAVASGARSAWVGNLAGLGEDGPDPSAGTQIRPSPPARRATLLPVPTRETRI
jgi:acetylglutamate kinase